MLSEKQYEFVMKPYSHTLDVAEGTPRSGKSTACVLRFFMFVNQSPDTNFLIVAASQEQAFRLVMDADGNGLIHLFGKNAEIKHDDYGCYLLAKTQSGVKHIYYKGGSKLGDDKKIRGLSLGGVMFCEIDILHMDMIQECFRRTYAATTRWHIADLNPPSPMHPVIKQVFDVQDMDWTHWTVHDNPIITDERKNEIEESCKKSDFLYKRDWLGLRCIPDGVIYNMFDTEKHILETIPKDAKIIEMFFSGDGGLTDATSISCNLVVKHEKKYMLLRVANWYYDGGKKAMSEQARDIVRDFIPYCRRKFEKKESDFFVDPACKALRKELELLGIDTRKADNNSKDFKGNVKGIKVGIEFLQNTISDGLFYLVQSEKFGHEAFLKEIGIYCVDNNGNPVDKYNHAMDECRYSNNYFVKHYIY